MKKVTFIFALGLLFFFAESAKATLLVKENFNYAEGSLVGQTNISTGTTWTAIVAAGSKAQIPVQAGSFEYTGYPSSAVGNKAYFLASASEIAALQFPEVTEGTVYLSALVNISASNATASYFMGFSTNSGTLKFYSNICTKKDAATGKIAFGIDRKNASGNFTGFDYDLNTTYLVVLKFEIIPGANNDICSILVNPAISITEPTTGWITKTDTYIGDNSISYLYIKQSNSTAGTTGRISGIRIATTWEEIMSEPTPKIAPSMTSLVGFKYTTQGGPSDQQSFNVSGSNLIGNVTITPSDNYEISLTSGSGFLSTPIILSHSGGKVSSTAVYVRLKAGLTVGTYSGENIVLTSPTAPTQNVRCDGSVITLVTASVQTLSGLTYIVDNGPSTEKPVYVSGINLTSDITVTPPANFEISTTLGGNFGTTPITLTLSKIAGTIASTPIYIRLMAGLPIAVYSGNLIVASAGVIPINVFVNGSSDKFTVKSNTVTVEMGPHTFSWTFDKPVTFGYFVDGQPWIIAPEEGVNLVSAVPARINGANVFDMKKVSVTADVNITVKNPPIGTYYNNNTGPIITKKAFGWDSRGAIRYATVADPNANYDSALGWDGITPMALVAGDIVSTAKSILTTLPGETVIDAAAVLTVLYTTPPADAFRPGVVRSADRRANPEFLTLSQMINLDSYIIQKPVTSVLGKTLAVDLPAPFLPSRLTSLIPGPSILNAGLNFSRSYKSNYNDNGQSYGAGMSEIIGDAAIGALAGWLTTEERQICRIRLVQRAIDTYEVLLAGGTLTHNGGHLPGYGALLTIVGKMMNHSGMLSVNQSVAGRDPSYFLSDYSQYMYIAKEGVNEPNTPAEGSMRRATVATNSLPFQNLTLPFILVGAGTITVNNSFEWPSYRAAREVLNLKLKIESGPGAGNNYYVVTDINDYLDASTGLPANTGTFTIKGGTLGIKPAWINGTPDATSIIKMYGIVPVEAPCWAFKSGGVNSTGNFADGFTLSPATDYSSVVLGATVSYICAMYALKAQDNFTSGMDQWMLGMLKKPGYGPYLFSESSSRYLYEPSGDLKIPGATFLSGIWKDQVLGKFNPVDFVTDNSIFSLPVPAYEQTQPSSLPFTNENSCLKLHHTSNSGLVSFDCEKLVENIEVYSVTGIRLYSKKINDYKGSFKLNGNVNSVFLIKVVLKDSIVIQKFIRN